MNRFILTLPKFSNGKSISHNAIGLKRKHEAADSSHEGEKGKKTQLYLDFGQKSFSATTQCENCNLFFRSHDLEDLKQHDQYCKDHSIAPKIPAVPVKSFCVLRERLEREEKILYHAKQRVFKQDSSLLEKQKSRTILTQYLFMQRLNDLMKFEFGEAIDEICWDKLDFYLVSEKRSVIGAVIVDQISSDTHIKSVETVEDLTLAREISGKEESSSSIRCLIGIRYLWVHRNFRRRKVAQRLIDEVCNHQIFGVEVSPKEVAFTQLTEDGLAFAQNYCDSRRVSCYNPF